MQNKNNPEGHEGPARRFVQFGGGVSAEQLDWLKQQLADAKAGNQHVIVCGHLPLHPDTCIGTCLLWNYEEVLQAIWSAGSVVATIAGHAHNVSSSMTHQHGTCQHGTITWTVADSLSHTAGAQFSGSLPSQPVPYIATFCEVAGAHRVSMAQVIFVRCRTATSWMSMACTTEC